MHIIESVNHFLQDRASADKRSHLAPHCNGATTLARECKLRRGWARVSESRTGSARVGLSRHPFYFNHEIFKWR